MEPVDKKKLDREITPIIESETEANDELVTPDSNPEPTPDSKEESEDARPRFGRRRRRAASSGVLTPKS